MILHRMPSDSDFCLRCGKSRAFLVEIGWPDCHDGENIVALQPLIARKRFKEMFAMIPWLAGRQR